MSYRGVHFAITDVDLTSLLRASSDSDLLGFISDNIEERWDEEWLVQTDKAWDAIHRCLTDGRLQYDNGEDPLRLCILGGRQLYRGDDYIVSLKEPEQCAEIANALAAIDADWLRSRYLAIEPSDFGRNPSEDDFEYTWGWFSSLSQFYAKASTARRHVVFTVDL